MSDVIVVMRDGPDSADGTTRPKCTNARQPLSGDFIGTSNFINSSVVGADGGPVEQTVRDSEGLTMGGS